jgi:hypothetical protein
MNNIIENADKSLTVNGTIRLNKIANPNNIPLSVSIRVILRCGNCAPKTELIWRPNLATLTGGRTVSGGVGIWTESSSAITEINNSRAELILREATSGTVLNNRNIFVATAGNAGSNSGWNASNGFTGIVGAEYRLSFSASVNSGTRTVDVSANRFQNENDDGTTSWVYQNNVRTTLTTTPQNIALNFVYSEGHIRLVGSRSGSGLTSTTITMRDIEIRRILAHCTGNCAEFAALNVPSITTAQLPNGETNRPYSQTLAATGGAISWSITSGNLPNGLTLATNGAISGTPTASGAFNFTARAANAIGSATRAFSLTITPPPTYTVIFNLAEGTPTDSTALTQTISHGENAILPAVPVLVGRVFDGWEGNHNNVTSNRTITAKWLRLGAVSTGGTGSVTSADATWLARHVAGHTGFELSNRRIANLRGEDRIIVSDDVTMLARWLVGYDLAYLISQMS